MTFFGLAPQQGTHVYTHGQNNYVVKMDLVQTTKSSISIIDSLDTHVISVKSLGEKEHRRLLLDPDIPIPSKRAMGMMHDKQTYRRNSYGDYWAQNKVFY